MTRKTTRKKSLARNSVVLNVTPEFIAFLAMAQKAKMFEVVADMHSSLGRITSEIQNLQKSTGKNQGAVLSQYLGQKHTLEHHIGLILESFNERPK